MDDANEDDVVVLPIGDTLDLHTFRPGDVGSLVPEWMAECRRAGLLDLRIIHGKGTGALAAGVRALLDRSAFVRAVRTDGNWGGVGVTLWDPADDEARVRTILAASPRLHEALDVVARHGPPGAWIGAGAIRNRIWHALHRRPGEPDETDVDVVWAGGGDPGVDAEYQRVLAEHLDRAWEVVDQRRYGAATAEAGMARWPETATGIAARLAAERVPPPGERGAAASQGEAPLTLFAAHGWDDVLGMVVRRVDGFPDADWRARLAAKRWRQRFPWVRIER